MADARGQHQSDSGQAMQRFPGTAGRLVQRDRSLVERRAKPFASFNASSLAQKWQEEQPRLLVQHVAVEAVTSMPLLAMP